MKMSLPAGMVYSSNVSSSRALRRVSAQAMSMQIVSTQTPSSVKYKYTVWLLHIVVDRVGFRAAAAQGLLLAIRDSQTKPMCT